MEPSSAAVYFSKVLQYFKATPAQILSPVVIGVFT